MPNEFDKLETKVVVKGHCGHYHPEDETEIVIVKIVKGKECPLEDVVSKLLQPEKQAVKHDAFTAPSQNGSSATKPNIIPPGLASMMIPPGLPGFEEKGSKMTRIV